VSKGFLRLSIIAVFSALASTIPWPGDEGAQAQFFPGFGAPQQINTARGAIQLAPGWHVATTPVRAGQGYRVAVRSEYGEQRNMFIGANGALAVESAPRPGMMRAPSRPMPKIERQSRKIETQKSKVKLAVMRAPGKPQAAPHMGSQDIKPAAVSRSEAKGVSPAPVSIDASPKAQAPTPSGPQAPGFAHGVPINPLD
jgi:hypothetical protein